MKHGRKSGALPKKAAQDKQTAPSPFPGGALWEVGHTLLGAPPPSLGMEPAQQEGQAQGKHWPVERSPQRLARALLSPFLCEIMFPFCLSQLGQGFSLPANNSILNNTDGKWELHTV